VKRPRWPEPSSFVPLRFILLVSAALAGCGRLIVPASTDAVDRTHIFLIAPGVGCADDAPTPIRIALPRRQRALEGAISALLARREVFDAGSGLVHSLYASHLTLGSAERVGDGVHLHLRGYVELGGPCAVSRVRAELERTALQFSDVKRVEIDIAGRPFEEILAEAEMHAR